jgi:hypothetical protein
MALHSLPGAWETGIQPPLLLIVREQIKAPNQVAYERVEAEIRRVCERWGCPNPYIALTSVATPREVWWLTGWSSEHELEQVGALYAANPALAARLAPLNARKRDLIEEPTTALAKAAGEAPFSLARARFVTVKPVDHRSPTSGALYDLPDGQRIEVAAHARPASPAPGGVLLALQPKWSLPPAVVPGADPIFWGREPY